MPKLSENVETYCIRLFTKQDGVVEICHCEASERSEEDVAVSEADYVAHTGLDFLILSSDSTNIMPLRGTYNGFKIAT